MKSHFSSWQGARFLPLFALLMCLVFGQGLALAIPQTPAPGSLPLSWGYNYYGQLGNNSTNNALVPVAVVSNGVLSGKTVVQVAAGQNHSLALGSDGTLASWGYNNAGQLGDGTTNQALVPLNITGKGALSGKTVTQIAAGGSHSLALCSDGTLVSWGYNADGELGNGSNTDSSLPVAVTATGVLSGKTVTQIAAGGFHSLALCSDGTLVSWGLGQDGELGNGNGTDSNVPVAVTQSGVLSGKTVVQVAAGSAHSLALCSDGTLASWGYNGDGELGNNSTSSALVPVAMTQSGVLSGKTVTRLAAGGSHSLALCSDSTLVSWGYNADGELGNNSTSDALVPVNITGTGALSGKTVVQVAAGGSHSLVLCSDGTLCSWGLGSSGQLGNGTTSGSLVPVGVTQSGVLKGQIVSKLMPGSIGDHNLVVAAANRPPVVAANSGLTVAQNSGARTVTNVQLQVTDPDSDPVTFTLASIPAQGVLSLSGSALKVGSTFAQADIDANRLSFLPGANAAVGADSFKFVATDGRGGATAQTTFALNIITAGATGGALISQFRLTGPGGAQDEFIELYNTSSSSLSLNGWTLQAGTTNIALSGPDFSGKSIPAGGHLLVVNSGGYSLSASTPGDVTYTGNIALNSTLSLLNPQGTLVDGVSNLMAVAAPTSSTSQYAYIRRLESGVPAKTGSDANDFNLVDTSSTQSTVGTSGVGTLTGARLGAPGPRNTQSPLQRNGLIALSKLNNPQVMNEAKYISKQGTLDKLGRLSLRRTLTNTSSGSTFTRLRLRIVATTSGSNANGAADLRAISSGGVRYYDANNGNAITQACIGMTLDAPSSPTEAPLTASSSGNGGGQNSSWTVALPSGGLAPGQSVNVEFLFGIAADGNYRVVVDTELLP